MFLLSFSLVFYKKATDFCKLILYPVTLLKLFMVSGSFLVEIFWSFRCKSMPSINRDSLTTFFPISLPFGFSCYLIALGMNSKSMLNQSRDTRHFCLFPDIRENDFSFSSFSIMLAIGLSYVAFTMLRYTPCILGFVRAFVMKGC
jgi:hypothetical protein